MDIVISTHIVSEKKDEEKHENVESDKKKKKD